MLLRRFYVQENEKGMARTKWNSNSAERLAAPEPKPKKDRRLNTDIQPASGVT